MQIHKPATPSSMNIGNADRDRQLQRLQHLVLDQRRHQRALGGTIHLLQETESVAALGQRALETLRESLGFVYGALWLRQPDGALTLSAESGSINEDFATTNRGSATGLVLRAACSGAPEIAAQLGDIPDCPRATSARRAAVRGALTLPFAQRLDAGPPTVVGVLEFYSMEPLHTQADPQELLQLLSQLLSRETLRFHCQQVVAEGRQREEAERNFLEQLLQASVARGPVEPRLASMLSLLMQQQRASYGSYWAVSREGAAPQLRFRLEQGPPDAEIQAINRSTGFQLGQGLTGRAWQQGAPLLVEDLNNVHDCPRAPAARRLRLIGAMAIPIVTAQDEVLGTLDLFLPERLRPTPALRDRLALVSRILGRFKESA